MTCCWNLFTNKSVTRAALWLVTFLLRNNIKVMLIGPMGLMLERNARRQVLDKTERVYGTCGWIIQAKSRCGS